MRGHGAAVRVGVQGTGAYGAEPARDLAGEGAPAANQIRDPIVTAPDDLHAKRRELETDQRVDHGCRLRPVPVSEPAEATKRSMRGLPRRLLLDLAGEIAESAGVLAQLCVTANPALLATRGVGPDVASSLLVAAGDNPNGCAPRRRWPPRAVPAPLEASSGTAVRPPPPQPRH